MASRVLLCATPKPSLRFTPLPHSVLFWYSSILLLLLDSHYTHCATVLIVLSDSFSSFFFFNLFRAFPTLVRGHGGCDGIWGVAILAGLILIPLFELTSYAAAPLLLIY